MEYPSKVLSKAVEEISGLPGIGNKSALRLALYLLKQHQSQAINLAESLIKLVKDIQYCKECYNFSDADICKICANNNRDSGLLCIVEDVRDVMAIENTGKFGGKYLVLGGKISPIEGIGPNQLHISALEEKAKNGNIREIILSIDFSSFTEMPFNRRVSLRLCECGFCVSNSAFLSSVFVNTSFSPFIDTESIFPL